LIISQSMRRTLKATCLLVLLESPCWVRPTIASSSRRPEVQISDPWPIVSPVDETFNFADASKASVAITILRPSGKPIDQLDCHSGNYDDPDFTYSGLFDCRLRSLNPSLDTYFQYDTLLTYDPAGEKDWESRARFLSGDLFDQCATDPLWGRVRQFQLRGMTLTLALEPTGLADVPQEWQGGPSVKSFRFTVKVSSNPGAIAAIDTRTARSCAGEKEMHRSGEVTKAYILKQGLQPPYPNIVPTGKRFVVPVGPFKELELPILDAHKRQIYKFKCSAGSGQAGISTWGIRCELRSTASNLNLLGDSVDLYSEQYRGLVQAEQLSGKCGTYPEWGAVRQFKLRAMQVTLSITGELSPMDAYRYDGGKQITVAVRAAPDPSAMCPVALPSRYVDWRFMKRFESCSTILTQSKTYSDLDCWSSLP
jgi:hypothetical protein